MFYIDQKLYLISTLLKTCQQEILLAEVELRHILNYFDDCPSDEVFQEVCFQWRNLLFSQVRVGSDLIYWYPQKLPIQIDKNLDPTSQLNYNLENRADILFWQIPNFLESDELHSLWDYVTTARSQFLPTHNSAGLKDYRQSLCITPAFEVYEWLSARVFETLISLADQIPHAAQEIGELEMQITAHNHGHYYKVHNDNGSPDTANRFLTYVYYFYRQPKSFSGGELRLYELAVKDGFYVAGDRYQDIEPIHNSLIIFPSHYMHEVLPIHCPSQQFEDSRFTVNGWIRSAT